MMISGVLVVCRAEHMAQTRAELAARPGLDVHHSEPSGRMVLTLDAASPEESVERLREIQQLPNVVLAELLEYVVEDE